MLVAYSNDAGSLLPQGVTQIRRKRVGNNYGLTSFNPEAGMA
jgi:hypothetical protein